MEGIPWDLRLGSHKIVGIMAWIPWDLGFTAGITHDFGIYSSGEPQECGIPKGILVACW